MGDVTQSSDAQPAPPSSEGEEDRGADRIRADTADYALDERNEMLLSYAGDDALGLSDDGSSGTVPTVPHLTPLEKKLMKVQKLIKKTEKRIAKKESMITKEKHHLDDLSVHRPPPLNPSSLTPLNWSLARAGGAEAGVGRAQEGDAGRRQERQLHQARVPPAVCRMCVSHVACADRVLCGDAGKAIS